MSPFSHKDSFVWVTAGQVSYDGAIGEDQCLLLVRRRDDAKNVVLFLQKEPTTVESVPVPEKNPEAFHVVKLWEPGKKLLSVKELVDKIEGLGHYHAELGTGQMEGPLSGQTWSFADDSFYAVNLKSVLPFITKDQNVIPLPVRVDRSVIEYTWFNSVINTMFANAPAGPYEKEVKSMDVKRNWSGGADQ